MKLVTILVLVDSVLQFTLTERGLQLQPSHNPCFSGQCFAIGRISNDLRRHKKSQSLF